MTFVNCCLVLCEKYDIKFLIKYSRSYASVDDEDANLCIKISAVKL